MNAEEVSDEGHTYNERKSHDNNWTKIVRTLCSELITDCTYPFSGSRVLLVEALKKSTQGVAVYQGR